MRRNPAVPCLLVPWMVLLAAGCGGGSSKPGDAGPTDAGPVDGGPNALSGAAGFPVLSSNSTFSALQDGGVDPTQLSVFLYDHTIACGGSNKPSADGTYNTVGMYISTADLASIPVGSYHCGTNAPLGGGHVLVSLRYLVEEVAGGKYAGSGNDFSQCTLELNGVAPTAQAYGTFDGNFAWPDGGKNSLSGSFNSTACAPSSN